MGPAVTPTRRQSGCMSYPVVVLVHVRERLAEAREAGLDFDAAWADAPAGVTAMRWHTALTETRHAWRLAYARTDPAGGTASFVRAAYASVPRP